jgi:hypothetical protein
MPLNTLQKLEILADAAKYDASCVSSGGDKRNAGSGLGSVTGQGICHAFTPDGRCISLLKILLTNFCIYDCAYCVSRRSSDVPRARFAVDEVVKLTLDLYRRNCIEGLFLSSGIARSVDQTMEELIRVAKNLREQHEFRGYIRNGDSGGQDRLMFGSGIAEGDLWLGKAGSDLLVSVRGSDAPDSVRVKGWYSDTSNRLSKIELSNGSVLEASRVQQMVQAMAAFSTNSGTPTSLTSKQEQTVDTVIAANWQSA